MAQVRDNRTRTTTRRPAGAPPARSPNRASRGGRLPVTETSQLGPLAHRRVGPVDPRRRLRPLLPLPAWLPVHSQDWRKFPPPIHLVGHSCWRAPFPRRTDSPWAACCARRPVDETVCHRAQRRHAGRAWHRPHSGRSLPVPRARTASGSTDPHRDRRRVTGRPPAQRRHGHGPDGSAKPARWGSGPIARWPRLSRRRIEADGPSATGTTSSGGIWVTIPLTWTFSHTEHDECRVACEHESVEFGRSP